VRNIVPCLAPSPTLWRRRGVFLEGDIGPQSSVLGVDAQPLLGPWLGVGLDRLDRAFRLANPTIDTFVRMNDQHVLASAPMSAAYAALTQRARGCEAELGILATQPAHRVTGVTSFVLLTAPAVTRLQTGARALQAYLGHKNIQHTVRYTELSPTRFKNFWRE
jgi:hypothetical protein